jgi:hypothetical protein
MDVFNIAKVIATIITTAIALIVAFRVLYLNRTDWLNRWFALFFISGSLGFSLYTTYHLILYNAQIIIPIMIMAQLFFNFNNVALTMTVFVLKKYTKIAMSIKYFGSMMALFLIMSVGYFIWIPVLDMGEYALGIVNTTTFLGLFLFVNAIRIALILYVVYAYTIITRKIENETRWKMQRFTKGVIFVILGLLTNLIAAIFDPPIEILIEILALILIDVGALFILYGFLIK